jgi:hypothetical protein
MLFNYISQKVLKKADLSKNKCIPQSGCFLDKDVILNLPNNFLFINVPIDTENNSNIKSKV